MVGVVLSALCLTARAGDVNPIIWADMPDPDVIRVGDSYYFVSTTMHYMPGAPVMRSKDLTNWELVSYVFDGLTDSSRYDLQDGTVYGRGQWATSLKYHDGKFYVLFCPNEQGDMGRSYIYTADDAAGPWTQVSRLPHFHDASLFFDDDGRVYVFYGTGEMVELRKDLSGVVEGSHHQVFEREADETGILEGSRVVKHCGTYYLLMISHVYEPGRHRREVCYRSKDLKGKWEKNVILESDLDGFGYTGQGTIVDSQWGDWYGIIFQDRGGVGRVPTLMPCRWIDGWPLLGDENGQIPHRMRPLTGHQTVHPVVVSDEFDNQSLDMHWQWNHNPTNAGWSLVQRRGWLRLKTVRTVDNLYLAPNTLTQRMEGPTCSSVVALDVSRLNDGDHAGFAAFNGQSGVLTVRREGNRMMLEMSEQQVNLSNREKAVLSVDVNVLEKIELPASVRWGKTCLYLRIDADFCLGKDIATFYYSIDGVEWNKIGRDFKMRFDWQRLFVGTRFAVFCYATKRTGGYVDIDFFRYNHP